MVKLEFIEAEPEDVAQQAATMIAPVTSVKFQKPTFMSRGQFFVLRFPIAHNALVVRMKICPSDTAGELSV